MKSSKSFQCAQCHKYFASITNLKRHCTSIHNTFVDRSNVYYECAHCGRRYNRKDNLKRHVLREEKFVFTTSFECDYCGVSFKRKLSLVLHMKANHIAQHSIKCGSCSCTFIRKADLRRHISQIHFGENSNKNKNLRCVLCDDMFHRKTDMLRHIEMNHKEVQIERELLQFNTMEDFTVWKNEEESAITCQFIKAYSKSNDYLVFYCHRSGQYTSMSKKRRPPLRGSKKINGYCPAEIKLRKDKRNNIYMVSYTKTHIGHQIYDENELKYLNLNKENREIIAEKIIAGISYNQILDNLSRSISSSSTGIDRLHLCKPQDLRNVSRTFNLKPARRLIKKCDINVEAFVSDFAEWILFYKRPNELSDQYPDLNENDIILIFMSPWQTEMFGKFGKDVVAIDDSYSMNPNDFFLQSVLVIDDYREGIPVLFAISNRNDEVLLDVIFTCIKAKVGVIHINCFMSNIQESYYNSWCKIMGEPKLRLYCSWHVQEAWRRNMKEIVNLDKRKIINEILDDLVSEIDEHNFIKKINEFINSKDEDIAEFLNYFRTCYVDNFQYWAYCYRMFAISNTNMHIASFHKNLNFWFGNKEKSSALSTGLHVLLKYVRKKERDFKIRKKKRKLHQELKRVQEQHDSFETSKSSTSTSIERKDLWTWLVPSFTQNDNNFTEMYLVTKIAAKCDRCPLLCKKCEVCFHEFQCSCVDSSVKHNMCKHIHLLSSFLKCTSKQECSVSNFDSVPPDQLSGSQYIFDNSIPIIYEDCVVTECPTSKKQIEIEYVDNI